MGTIHWDEGNTRKSNQWKQNVSTRKTKTAKGQKKKKTRNRDRRREGQGEGYVAKIFDGSIQPLKSKGDFSDGGRAKYTKQRSAGGGGGELDRVA